MKISIITPTFNHAQFIERTIDSVLEQGYGDLEFIIMDGGSSDNTLEILKKYGDKIIWKSEKDKGQSDAINKGLKLATGEIVAFLNSDDVYMPGALQKVADFFGDNPDTYWAYGKCKIIDENDRVIRHAITLYKNMLLRTFSYNKLLSENFISQPATFWRRVVHEKIGYLNEDEHFVMDYEFWLRLGQEFPAGVIADYLACFRMYDSSKSGNLANSQFKDELRVAKKFSRGAKLPILLHNINYFKITWTYRIMAMARGVKSRG